MKLDSLKKYVSLRDSLQKEKAKLEERLAQINAALQQEEPATASPKKAAPGRRARAATPKRAVNAISLKEAIHQVTAEKPLTKDEILKAVKKIGYKFSTDKPLNSIGVVLYGKNQFKNDDGKFSPLK